MTIVSFEQQIPSGFGIIYATFKDLHILLPAKVRDYLYTN